MISPFGWVTTPCIRAAGMVAGVLLAAIALASCGLGSDTRATAPESRSSPEIVDCLESAAAQANFTVSESEEDLDEIARKTTDRAVAAELKGSRAMIVIEGSEEDAAKTRTAYRGSKFLGDLGTIEQYGTIVVAYEDIPDAKQRDALFECVGSGVEG